MSAAVDGPGVNQPRAGVFFHHWRSFRDVVLAEATVLAGKVDPANADTRKKAVGDRDHLNVFANAAAAEMWFAQNDAPGVAFEQKVFGRPSAATSTTSEATSLICRDHSDAPIVLPDLDGRITHDRPF